MIAGTARIAAERRVLAAARAVASAISGSRKIRFTRRWIRTIFRATSPAAPLS
jgi:hypothetical protein